MGVAPLETTLASHAKPFSQVYGSTSAIPTAKRGSQDWGGFGGVERRESVSLAALFTILQCRVLFKERGKAGSKRGYLFSIRHFSWRLRHSAPSGKDLTRQKVHPAKGVVLGK